MFFSQFTATGTISALYQAVFGENNKKNQKNKKVEHPVTNDAA